MKKRLIPMLQKRLKPMLLLLMLKPTKTMSWPSSIHLKSTPLWPLARLDCHTFLCHLEGLLLDAFLFKTPN